MKLERIKKAPTAGTVKGETLNTNLSYQDKDGLSTAAEILLLICQVSDHAECMRHARWRRFDQVLRRHYEDELCEVVRGSAPNAGREE